MALFFEDQWQYTIRSFDVVSIECPNGRDPNCDLTKAVVVALHSKCQQVFPSLLIAVKAIYVLPPPRS